jgi:hypothetical protein
VCCGKDGQDRWVRLSDTAYVRFFIDSVQGETLTYAQAAELQVFYTGANVPITLTAKDAGWPNRGRHRGTG